MLHIVDNDLPAPLIRLLREPYVAHGVLKQNLDRARSFHAPEQQAVMDTYPHQHLRPSFHLGAPSHRHGVVVPLHFCLSVQSWIESCVQPTDCLKLKADLGAKQ
jgi:hypothetical protein